MIADNNFSACWQGAFFKRANEGTLTVKVGGQSRGKHIVGCTKI